jgi:acyl carrier protein
LTYQGREVSKRKGSRGMNIKEEIREFILNNFLKGDRSKRVADDTSFIEEGIIDSIGILELVAFLEEKFGIKVEDDEIAPENFESLEKLDSYIKSKAASQKV